MTVERFVASRRAGLATGALTEFAETELHAVTDVYGAVAQRRSTYHKRGVRDGVAFEAVGVILTQFVHGAGGWRISAMAWDDERPGLANPDPAG
jgi:hypothetical protein